MSKLQPNFIAKAKQQIKKPMVRLPRKMILEASKKVVVLHCLGGSIWGYENTPDYRQFSLKK